MRKIFEYSWRRYTIVLALVAVLAASAVLKLSPEVTSAFTMALAAAIQFFFKQHESEGSQPSPPKDQTL